MTPTKQTSAYGSWDSPITADAVATAGVGLNGLGAAEDGVSWGELRPAEGGRTVVVHRRPDGSVVDLFPDGFNARSRVHEYGGGAWFRHRDVLFFSNFADQRLYRVDPGADPVAITPEPAQPGALRYADGILTADGKAIVCVREAHSPGREATNELVMLPADGSSEPTVIATGHDFYASPRLSPDGRMLAFLTWDHPNMPWDGTTLHVAAFSADVGLSDIREVAGGRRESITQPRWSPDGLLYYASDRTGWWNLYRFDGRRQEALCEMAAEFAGPQWAFGMSTYGFGPSGEIYCIYGTASRSRLGRLAGGALEALEIPYTTMTELQVAPDGSVLLMAASPSQPVSAVRYVTGSGECEVLKRSREQSVPEEYVSVPEAIEFPTEGGLTAHALFYAPTNAAFEGPDGERPPLIVFSHGGPTGAVTSSFNASIQFWTSRGLAVVDVNYGGSSGYGREYRERLNGKWGIVDVDDCVNAALYLALRGDVDPERMAVRGGSAGGWTTLCCLAFRDVFRAGANHFGVAELESFVGDTHKFESRYLDSLIGPYPEKRELYRERSPLSAADRISAPLITFQGLEDAVVPPSQSEQIVEALKRKGVPYAYVTFEGEQHGFRRASSIKRALELELSFYGQVFGFEPSGNVERVHIENL